MLTDLRNSILLTKLGLGILKVEHSKRSFTNYKAFEVVGSTAGNARADNNARACAAQRLVYIFSRFTRNFILIQYSSL